MAIKFKRKDGTIRAIRNAEYLAGFYFIPKEFLDKCSAKIRSIPRRPRDLLYDEQALAVVESDVFLEAIIDVYAYMVWPYMGLGRKMEIFSGDAPEWRYAHAAALWIQGLKKLGIIPTIRDLLTKAINPPHICLCKFESVQYRKGSEAMKAVIYARYSSDSQREESIEGQIRECSEYAERNKITILTSYIDRALSARTADRPDFQRMIRDSEKGLFDTVLVWKLDRFSRDRYDSAHYKHILKKNGVKVVSAKENISEGPEGIILESMLEGYAEYYSAELSQKIQRGQKENAMKCKNNGGHTPLGYCVDREHGVLAIDPVTAPIVREIYTRYDGGERIREIRDSLNIRGIRTQMGKPFSTGAVSLILKNRKYIGEYRYGDVTVPDGMPAIIGKDMFERVSLRMEANKKAPAKAKADEEYLLTTKLFCGTCGRMMAGESGKSGTKGIKYRYYKCSGAKRSLGCHRKPLRKDWIERVAVLLTVRQVLTDETIDRIADAIVVMQEEEDTTIPAMERQLRECEKGIANMLNAIQAGILTASTKERLEELERQRDALNVSILTAQMERPKYTKQEIVQWISRYKVGSINDKDYQKEIIDTFLNSIYVYDDRLVFTYNYRDGTETLTLQEVEAAFSSDLKNLAPP